MKRYTNAGTILALACALALVLTGTELRAQDDGRRFEAVRLFNQAQDKYNRADYQGAVADYSNAIRQYPAYYDAYGRRAEAQIKLQNYAGAIESYQQMIRIFPNDAGVYRRLGDAYVALGNWDLALDAYNQLISRDGGREPRQLRTAVYLQLGRYADALADYDALIEQEREEGQLYLERGRIYQLGGNLQAAIADYDRAALLRPDDIEVRVQRATALYFERKNLRALDDCEIVLKRDGQNALALYTRANARFALGFKADALREVDQIAQLAPVGVFAFQARALARLNRKDYAGAVADLSEAVRLQPAFALAYLQRGQAHAGVGDRPKARSDYAEASRLFGVYGDATNLKLAQEALQKLGS
jgi:tetratricopeptide (TPR) repeat protein